MVPFERTAQECWLVLMSITLDNLVFTGLALSVAKPSPRRPREPSPKQKTSRPVVRTQVWRSPAAICSTFGTAAMLVGDRTGLFSGPHCCEVLLPQHFNVPPAISAHI